MRSEELPQMVTRGRMGVGLQLTPTYLRRLCRCRQYCTKVIKVIVIVYYSVVELLLFIPAAFLLCARLSVFVSIHVGVKSRGV